ncbi:universal stress protein [Halomicroarcula sp. GCM10025709]|uniref:universal stress protein n=1 Tax=Haloarcula TaxID=2237 RepID=UPI0024C2E8BF|nr:universal stress protein [Halomicroarcula sp. YJ-61-S]
MAHDRVLLAIGPEDRDSLDTLVEAAIDMAEPAGATVYLLYVFPRDDYETVMEQMDIDTATSGLTPDEVAQRHESVREPADRLASLDIDYEIRGVSGGNPADQIVRTVEQVGADVAIVGGTKRSPAGKAMFGDHAQRVLLNSPVPVLYVKRE